MRISGTAELAASPEAVFDALNDPAVLGAAIPGVERLEPLGDDRYRMTITAGVASVKGSYTGEVALSEQSPPHSFTLRGSGSGAPGTVDATVRVRLEAEGAGTRLTYDADAVVGGMVGGVGQRMLSSVATRMAAQFFGAVDRLVVEGVPVLPAPRPAGDDDVAALAVPATAARAPAEDGRVPLRVVLAGVGAGAFWALAGVAVGWTLARRGRS